MNDTEPIPILIISDAPSSTTGLGRITRDLAVRMNESLKDICRVATLGYGGAGSRKLGFQQYVIEGMSEWIIPTLPEIWEDFAGKQKGICMTIWDASRLMWLSQPARCEMLGPYQVLRNWLMQAPFRLWGYFPIDASGPNDKLTYPLHQTLLGFDRILAYGKWAKGVVEQTIGSDAAKVRNLDWLPHGIDTSVFYERNRPVCRYKFGSITKAQTLQRGPRLGSVLSDEILIGIVATNQARKNWALGIKTVALLAKKHKVRLWIHTDGLERNWSIPSMLVDYNLVDKAAISLGILSDDEMAQAYSACNLTLGIGSEGFGFPLAESQACGTPVITGSYAGGAELVQDKMRVEPIAYQDEGLFTCKRPVFQASDWAMSAEQWMGKRVALNPQYNWNNLWPNWEKWVIEGINCINFKGV
jgi:glycosyltransferase involved in cell wall biosynthesis